MGFLRVPAPLRIGPAEDCARGPVGTLGMSGIECFTGALDCPSVRLI